MTSPSSNPPASKVKRIADEQPVFPCWLRLVFNKKWIFFDFVPNRYFPNGWKSGRYDLWSSNDRFIMPEAPKEVPGIHHASDCAVHNEPAFRNGPCDCGATTATADLPAPASEEAKEEWKAGDIARVVRSPNYAWNGVEVRLIEKHENGVHWKVEATSDLSPKNIAYWREENLFRESPAHPTTDEAIAREMTEDLIKWRSTTADPETGRKMLTAYFLSVLQRARSSQQKGAV